MGFFICLFCVVFLQTVYGRVAPYSGQNSVNVEHKMPFSYTNARSLATNGQTIRVPNGVPSNKIARNEAITGNILANPATNANSNICNANVGNVNQANVKMEQCQANANQVNTLIENVNPSTSNQINTNLANSKPTSNFGNVKLAAQNLPNNIAINKIARTNLQGDYGSFGCTGFSNPNLIKNFRPNLANRLYRSNFASPVATNLPNQLFGNIANSYIAPNACNPFANSFNSYGLASYLPNFATGNIGNGNIASSNFGHTLATGSLANTIMPGASFAIGGNPFTVLSGLPGNQPIGLTIVADALEVGGSVSVAGKMPFHGTVELSGSLPADGTATVNYGCHTQHSF